MVITRHVMEALFCEESAQGHSKDVFDEIVGLVGIGNAAQMYRRLFRHEFDYFACASSKEEFWYMAAVDAAKKVFLRKG